MVEIRFEPGYLTYCFSKMTHRSIYRDYPKAVFIAGFKTAKSNGNKFKRYQHKLDLITFTFYAKTHTLKHKSRTH